jgi:hypothetical protein
MNKSREGLFHVCKIFHLRKPVEYPSLVFNGSDKKRHPLPQEFSMECKLVALAAVVVLSASTHSSGQSIDLSQVEPTARRAYEKVGGSAEEIRVKMKPEKPVFIVSFFPEVNSEKDQPCAFVHVCDTTGKVVAVAIP